mmetsp:Transcript_27368/g.63861  ORF Transcript_27368/g.63861 Transcript_27368/m.63861 type:complete len:83 (-) Transcript_27368:1196-1444(-)
MVQRDMGALDELHRRAVHSVGGLGLPPLALSGQVHSRRRLVPWVRRLLWDQTAVLDRREQVHTAVERIVNKAAVSGALDEAE